MTNKTLVELDTEKIKRLMLQKGWDANELAERLGVSRQQVYNMFYTPVKRMRTVKMLADALGVNPERIVK